MGYSLWVGKESDTTEQLTLLPEDEYLQVQGEFVPCFSLRPVLKIEAAYVIATVQSSCSSLLPSGRGFSLYKRTHKIWLRLLSIALEKKLELLDFA